MKELDDLMVEIENNPPDDDYAELVSDYLLLVRALREALPGVYSADAMQGKKRAERVYEILKGKR